VKCPASNKFGFFKTKLPENSPIVLSAEVTVQREPKDGRTDMTKVIGAFL
jgi:hypothetical protein